MKAVNKTIASSGGGEQAPKQRKALPGQSVYRNPGDQSGKGTARRLTKADYEKYGAPSRTTRPGLKKDRGVSGAGPVARSKSPDRVVREAATKSSRKQNKALGKSNRSAASGKALTGEVTYKSGSGTARTRTVATFSRMNGGTPAKADGAAKAVRALTNKSKKAQNQAISGGFFW
jgi:hypothetical protein